MLRFLCRRLQILVRNGGITATNSTTDLGFIYDSLLFTVRSLSSSSSLNTKKRALKAEDDQQMKRSHTASYLINSCGFSLESAESVSRKIHFETPEKVDRVIKLLRDHGFTNVHISKVIRSNPRLLFAKPKTLLPKLDFLCSIGISGPDLGKIISRNPGLLSWGLKATLIPSYNALRNILHSDEKVVMCLQRSCQLRMHYLHKNAPINVSVLRGLGMPQSNISFFVTNRPNIVIWKPDQFAQLVNKVLEIGCDPLKFTFVHAIEAFGQMSHKTWERKMEVYRSWGLSEDEIWLAFRKYPRCLIYSEKKIMNTMDFLVNKMAWKAATVARFPYVFCYSLEKRIVPRCSVIRVLLLKGLVKGEIHITSVLSCTEKQFVRSFVIEYQQEVPQLSSIFRGETSILELGFGFEEKSEARNL